MIAGVWAPVLIGFKVVRWSWILSWPLICSGIGFWVMVTVRELFWHWTTCLYLSLVICTMVDKGDSVLRHFNVLMPFSQLLTVLSLCRVTFCVKSPMGFPLWNAPAAGTELKAVAGLILEIQFGSGYPGRLGGLTWIAVLAGLCAVVFGCLFICFTWESTEKNRKKWHSSEGMKDRQKCSSEKEGELKIRMHKRAWNKTKTKKQIQIGWETDGKFQVAQKNFLLHGSNYTSRHSGFPGSDIAGVFHEHLFIYFFIIFFVNIVHKGTQYWPWKPLI